MKDIQLKLSSSSDAWKLEVYDPNLQHIIGEAEKNFSTPGQAAVWMEIWGEIESSKQILDDAWVIRGSMPASELNLEELLTS